MRPLKIIFAALAAFPFLFAADFGRHFYFYLSGKALIIVDSGNIAMMLLSIAFFCSFFYFVSFQRIADWREYSLFGGFFVSLFVEMYGAPLTIDVLQTVMHRYTSGVTAKAADPGYVINAQIGPFGFGMDLAMAYGAVVIASGIVLMAAGWKKLYESRNEEFARTGIYSHSRHPQYLGFICVVAGWFVGWPSPVTLIFTPILVWRYHAQALFEEKWLEEKHPDYRYYRWAVPFYF